MKDATRRTLLARLAVISAAGYVAPKAIVIDPAYAKKDKCPPSPFDKGKGPCK